MTPRFSVIEFTTPRLSFAQDLAVYREAGVDAIGIVEEKLSDDREDLARFRASGLRSSSFFPATSSILPAPANPGPADPTLRVADLRQSIRRFVPFEPDCCFVTTGPYGRYEAQEAEKIVIDALQQLAAEAASAGMALAVEMMHPSLAKEFTFVNSILDAVALVDKVHEPNIAVALDIWHLTDSPKLLADVRDHASRFASVHVNDRQEPRGSWRDRRLPGDGVADLAGIFGSLANGGFDGWFELEVHSDAENDLSGSLWNRDPLELVSVGRAQFLSAWEDRRS